MASLVEHTKEGIKCIVWDENFILDTLVSEAVELKNRIEMTREREDYGTYKNLILAFKEIVNLIHEEDDKSKWKEFSSHYYDGDKAIKGENEYIATWEQNGNDDIRNHRIFKVEKEVSTIRVEIDKNYIIDGDTLTIPIKVNGKNSCSIKGKRVDDKWVLESGTTIKCN